MIEINSDGALLLAGAIARQWIREQPDDLALVANWLGHSDVAVTWQHYAIFRMAELAAKHEQHSPIARMGREGEL